MKERYWTGPMKAGPCVPLDEVSFCLLKARYGCAPFSDSEMVLRKRKEKNTWRGYTKISHSERGWLKKHKNKRGRLKRLSLSK